MMDYTTDVITQYLKMKGLNDPNNADIVICWEMSEWINETCEVQHINGYAKRYVDFTQMLFDDDDLEIFIRREDGTIVEVIYDTDSTKEWINNSPYNSVFVIQCN